MCANPPWRAAILNEKRRRRRESHNAVERRRRDNINEKISELSTLLPDCMLEVAPSASPAVEAEDDGKDTPAMKANKGIILRKSVEYIRCVRATNYHHHINTMQVSTTTRPSASESESGPRNRTIAVSTTVLYTIGTGIQPGYAGASGRHR